MKKDINRNHDQEDCDFSLLNPDIFIARDRNSLLKEDFYGNYQYESPVIENHAVYGYDRTENTPKNENIPNEEQAIDEDDEDDQQIIDNEDEDVSDDFNTPDDFEHIDDDENIQGKDLDPESYTRE